MASFLAALRDEDLARQYIESALPQRRVFDGVPIPQHKWLQAVYLTNGGRLYVHAEHLAAILDISMATAATVSDRLQRFKEELAPLVSEMSAVAGSTSALRVQR